MPAIRHSQRKRRGAAFPLVFSSSTSPESCEQQDVGLILRPWGCIPHRVVVSACLGTCHSRSVPQWDIEGQQVRHVNYCSCCKPHRVATIRINFRCPGRPIPLPPKHVRIATQCACRPCSDADPDSHQPYDY
jgi:hypothetical protein